MKSRILLVDDEPDYTRLLSLNLQLLGKYEVMQENCASRALSTARSFHPDLILLDVMMPDLDGPDVAARIRADESLRHTPMAFLTVLVSTDGTHNLSGPDGCVFLPKLGDLVHLLGFIDRIITGRETAGMN